MIPRVYGHSYAIEAELSVPEQGAEGVIVAEADEMGGFSLWVDDERAAAPQLLDDGRRAATSRSRPSRSRPGTSPSACSSTPTAQERSAGGTVSLYANDQQIGEGRVEKTVSFRFSGYAGMDIGRDNGLVVDRAYAAKAPVPLHRHRQESRLRPQAGGQARGRESAARGRQRTARRHTASAPKPVELSFAAK